MTKYTIRTSEVHWTEWSDDVSVLPSHRAYLRDELGYLIKEIRSPAKAKLDFIRAEVEDDDEFYYVAIATDGHVTCPSVWLPANVASEIASAMIQLVSEYNLLMRYARSQQ